MVQSYKDREKKITLFLKNIFDFDLLQIFQIKQFPAGNEIHYHNFALCSGSSKYLNYCTSIAMFVFECQ